MVQEAFLLVTAWLFFFAPPIFTAAGAIATVTSLAGTTMRKRFKWELILLCTTMFVLVVSGIWVLYILDDSMTDEERFQSKFRRRTGMSAREMRERIRESEES